MIRPLTYTDRDRANLAVSSWRAAQDAERVERQTVMAIVCEMNASGVSEYALSGAFGVSRKTIRTWLGKP